MDELWAEITPKGRRYLARIEELEEEAEPEWQRICRTDPFLLDAAPEVVAQARGYYMLGYRNHALKGFERAT